MDPHGRWRVLCQKIRLRSVSEFSVGRTHTVLTVVSLCQKIRLRSVSKFSVGRTHVDVTLISFRKYLLQKIWLLSVSKILGRSDPRGCHFDLLQKIRLRSVSEFSVGRNHTGLTLTSFTENKVYTCRQCPRFSVTSLYQRNRVTFG